MNKIVVTVILPAPDSHFRLVPCGCGSENVVYEQYQMQDAYPWRVRCFDCGRMVDKGYAARHDAQVAWNREVRL